MKKLLSVILSVMILSVSLLVNVSAADDAKISAYFYSDIGNMSDADIEKFINYESSNLVMLENRCFVCDYINEMYFGELKKGRTYYIYYEFDVQDGYVFSDELNEDNVSFACDDNAKIVYYYYVNTFNKDERKLYVCEKVQPDGNIFQRFIGRIADIILKIRAWSLY